MELLWLDLFPAGSYIPPLASLALTAALGLLACLHPADMRSTLVVLMMVLPMAYFGAWAEQQFRKRQNLSYNALSNWNRRNIDHPYAPDGLIVRAVAENFLMYAFVYLLCTLPALVLLRTVQPFIPSGWQPAWPVLWTGASIGAVLSLRLKKAYILGGMTVVLGILVTL